jgi:hypothetical protein
MDNVGQVGLRQCRAAGSWVVRNARGMLVYNPALLICPRSLKPLAPPPGKLRHLEEPDDRRNKLKKAAQHTATTSRSPAPNTLKTQVPRVQRVGTGQHPIGPMRAEGSSRMRITRTAASTHSAGKARPPGPAGVARRPRRRSGIDLQEQVENPRGVREDAYGQETTLRLPAEVLPQSPATGASTRTR